MPRAWTWLAVGATAGLFTAAAELVLLSLNRGAAFSSAAALFGPVARTVLAVAAVSLALSILTWWVLRRVGAGGLGTAIATAIAVAATALAYLVGPSPPPWLGTASRQIAFAAVCWGVLTAALSLSATTLPKPAARRAASLLAAAPWVASLAFLLQWRRTSIRRLGEEPSTVEAWILFVVLLGVGWFAWRSDAARWGRLNLGAAGLVVAVGFLVPAPAAPELPVKVGAERLPLQHVVLITIDTLRSDALSAYGGENQTPSLDGLASDGVVFRQASSASPWTLPSLASILTGVSPPVHGAQRLGQRPSDQVPTLGELMGQAGYTTAVFGWNFFLSPAGHGAALVSPFDLTRFGPTGDTITASDRLWAWSESNPSALDFQTEDLGRLSSQWAADHSDQPFFLWVHFFDPHLPYSPPDEFRPLDQEPHPTIGETYDGTDFDRFVAGEIRLTPSLREWLRALYDAEVRYVDREVGRILSALKDLDLYDDALIVLASDHGEEFGEHGRLDHGHSLYEELLATPLVIKLPGGGVRRVVENPVTNTAIVPTVLEIARLEEIGALPQGLVFSSPSLAPYWADDGQAPAPQPVYAEGNYRSDDKESVRLGDYKLIRYRDLEQIELFDLSEDPKERINRFADLPDLVADLTKLLDERREDLLAVRRALGLEGGEVELNDAQRDRLRSLGYVQ